MTTALEEAVTRRVRRLRRKAFSGAFRLLARANEGAYRARLKSGRVELMADVPYGAHPIQKLDIYRPVFAPRPLPVLLYIHGGGFTLCSKDTHRGIASVHASRGQFLVFNIDYRLAPRFRYPAAHEDACLAYRWVVDNAARYGGDPSRIIVAGESAGGNLALSVSVASSYQRPEPWARLVYDCGVQPRAVQPLMPFLQVSNPWGRMLHPAARRFSVNAVHDISRAYLGASFIQASADNLMADPIRVLEEAGPPSRPLPPMFSGVGTADMCSEDTRRLELACQRLRVEGEFRYYPHEIHAFHVLRWRSQARQFWQDSFGFLGRYAGT